MYKYLINEAIGDVAGSTYEGEKSEGKNLIRRQILDEYYPDCSKKKYANFHGCNGIYSACSKILRILAAYCFPRRKPCVACEKAIDYIRIHLFL